MAGMFWEKRNVTVIFFFLLKKKKNYRKDKNKSQLISFIYNICYWKLNLINSFVELNWLFQYITEPTIFLIQKIFLLPKSDNMWCMNHIQQESKLALYNVFHRR